MFGESLVILHLLITTSTVSFLTPDFMHSQIVCMNDVKHDYAIDRATGHNYNLNVINKDCALTITGTNEILFPSIRHSLSIRLGEK